jgi:hemolysin activation/secretion protein
MTGFIVLRAVGAYAFDIPSNVDAGTLQHQLEQREPETFKPIPSPRVASQPDVSVPHGADMTTLVLKKLVIEGVKSYPPGTFDNLYAPLIGTRVTLADLYRLVAAEITQVYHEDGYSLAQAYLPPQTIDNGEVHIRVVEGYIKTVTWSGDLVDSAIISDVGYRLETMRPFNGTVLEETLLSLNDLPGISVQAVMTPLSKEDAEDGAVGLQLEMTRQRVTAQLTTDDYNSRYLGTWESLLHAQATGVISGIDYLSFDGSLSPGADRMQSGRLEYGLPINASGTTAKIGFSASHTTPGYTLEDLDVQSKAQSAWVGMSQPLMHTRLQSLSVDGQFMVQDAQTHILNTPNSDDRLRSLKLSALYSLADSWNGSNNLSADVEQGLNGLGATDAGSLHLSRAYGHSDFTKLTFNASRLQMLDDDFSIVAASNGQLSDEPLLSEEQYGFGGPAFGRAYATSEITGDSAIAGSLELRYSGWSWDDARQYTVQPFLYYDIGKVWNRGPAGDEVSAASAGGGMRLQVTDHCHFELTLAQPLTHTPQTSRLGVTDGTRLGLSLKLNE